MRKTKIVCTLGPASWDEEHLSALIDAGMNVARLNFSHVTPDQYPHYRGLIAAIRRLSEEKGNNVMVLQDLAGLKIRIGKIDGTRALREGEIVRLTVGMKPEGDSIPIQYHAFADDVRSGERIMFCDGRIVLRAMGKRDGAVLAEVQNDGEILSFKGVNIPDTVVSAPAVTEKDKGDVRFGVGEDVDWISVSFVRTAEDVHAARTFIMENGGVQKVLVKVERRDAVENFEAIVQAADGIMVARGDLGVELPFSAIPVHQKRMIGVANIYGKPVIVATQMLSSMVREPTATRAEISDIANAVHDRTDAVMLSEETAVGKYPVEAVRVMAETIHAMEASIAEQESVDFPARARLTLRGSKDMETTLVAYHALRLAEDARAKFVAVVTRRGYSALQIARFRPLLPVVTFVPLLRVKRELALVYGINQVVVSDFSKEMVEDIAIWMRSEKKLSVGDKIVVVAIGREDSVAQRDDVRLVTYR